MNIPRHARIPAAAATTAADEAVFATARETADPGFPPRGLAPHRRLTGWRRHTGRTSIPGVSRDYAVHVPANLDPATPASLLVVPRMAASTPTKSSALQPCSMR